MKLAVFGPGHPYRGGIATTTTALVQAMRERGLQTAFTIARAYSAGMNITFAKHGYQFGGTLTSNTNISGKIESMNIWIGRAFGWCILILTFGVSYEVFVRYVLNAPTVWSFDMMIQMYGALLLMSGPYALAQDTHVRGDVLYRLFPVKWQARLDFLLYILFFFPGMIALFWFGWEIAQDSWRYKEVSIHSPAGIQVYFFKTLIPVAGILMMIQGFAELLRCWMAMAGESPSMASTSGLSICSRNWRA